MQAEARRRVWTERAGESGTARAGSEARAEQAEARRRVRTERVAGESGTA
ncbi:hypothetical protein [Paenibacillus rigui]|nr:hypothetical protein [Paenibacillus rigui]